MTLMATFFRLVRWRNLLIVFVTQWFVWQCVIHPMAGWQHASLFLTAPHFLLLSLSTVLIAAAGYIINDYFDVKIDVINRPEKVIVERAISRRSAILLHSLFNLLGFLLAFLLARKMGMYQVMLIQLACTVLLWFYSTHFKRQFVIGNLVVALLTALSILILAVYEPALYAHVNLRFYLVADGKGYVNPFGVVAVYTFFAFMLTWMREVVKDMEDFKGDAEDGCITMPIKLGLRRSVHFVWVLGILALIPLTAAGIKLLLGNWWLLGVYVLLLLVLPLLLWLRFLPRRATSGHYGQASKWLKVIMVSGVCSLLIYYWLQFFIQGS